MRRFVKINVCVISLLALSWIAIQYFGHTPSCPYPRFLTYSCTAIERTFTWLHQKTLHYDDAYKGAEDELRSLVEKHASREQVLEWMKKKKFRYSFKQTKTQASPYTLDWITYSANWLTIHPTFIFSKHDVIKIPFDASDMFIGETTIIFYIHIVDGHAATLEMDEYWRPLFAF